MARTRRGAAARETIAPAAAWWAEPLDPWLMCGPDTSVTELWRAAETRPDGAQRFHLVFHDRYGWYCEHGRSCPAVQEVRRAVREYVAALARRPRHEPARQTAKRNSRTRR